MATLVGTTERSRREAVYQPLLPSSFKPKRDATQFRIIALVMKE
jgi:hypothetical protein